MSTSKVEMCPLRIALIIFFVLGFGNVTLSSLKVPTTLELRSMIETK